MQENIAVFESLPDEMRAHIASFLDVKSLCFFAATSKRSLGNAQHELKKIPPCWDTSKKASALKQMPQGLFYKGTSS